MDRTTIEKLSRGQKLSWSIHLAIERCRDCDKQQQKGSIDKLSIERCRGAVEIALKQFLKREKQRYECNQTCNSTKDPNNILTSQKHLSTRKMSSILIPKHTHTHTHTLNKSNQFYIPKTSLHKCLHVMTIWDIRKSL